MKGKPHKIDILKLYANNNSQEWNLFLSTCLNNKNLQALEKVLYGIQLGMNDVANKGLNTDKINIFFIRLQRSLERTIRDIVRLKEPHALDNPLNVEKFGYLKDSKQKRDHNIEKHLKKVRF